MGKKYYANGVVTSVFLHGIPCHIFSKRAAIAANRGCRYLWGGGVCGFRWFIEFDYAPGIVVVGMVFQEDGKAIMVGYLDK